MVADLDGDEPGTRLPRQIGPFIVDKELWHGAQSRVYLARDSRDHASVALKVLYPQAHCGADAQRRIAAMEASRLRDLSHPNIVPLRKHGEIDGVPYLCFPFVDGLGLDQSLNNGDIEHGALMAIMLKICRALQHAHEMGFIHRDLKPRNILIDKNNEPHLLDWGLSWRRGMKSEPGVQKIVGTPAYMSPEQARGEEENLTPASDVYSVGAILYHMLTGHPPFEAETSWKTMQMTMSLPPRPPSTLKTTIDLRVERMVLWCLAKEPEKRYGDAGALGDDLQRVLDGGSPRGPAGFLGRLFKK